jgi:hypothetical protein
MKEAGQSLARPLFVCRGFHLETPLIENQRICSLNLKRLLAPMKANEIFRHERSGNFDSLKFPKRQQLLQSKQFREH